MVGGLIEQESIGLGHQRRCQGQAFAVAPRELSHLAAVITDAQPAEYFLALALKFPGFGFIHAIADLAELPEEPRIVRRLLQLLAETFVALNQLHFFAAISEHLLQHRALRIEAGVLIDVNHAVARIDLNASVANRLQPCHHPKQGGFA